MSTQKYSFDRNIDIAISYRHGVLILQKTDLHIIPTRMGFYDLSEAQRIALTTKAIDERRTVIERWVALDVPEAAAWNERAARAADLLSGCTTIADLGCGTMQLQHYLQTGTNYIPVDVVARDARTIVVDLNRQPLPRLVVDGFAAIGLLEYLFDVPAFLVQLSGILVTSYNPTDICDENRLSHAWVNAYDTAALEAIFRDCGWSIDAFVTFGSQRLWKLRS